MAGSNKKQKPTSPREGERRRQDLPGREQSPGQKPGQQQRNPSNPNQRW